MSLRTEFVVLASAGGANVRALCRRFGISPTTAYKWLGRYRQGGVAGLVDRSRRPRHSPRRTPSAVEAAVLALRDARPAWGARKIHARLKVQTPAPPALPSPSTMNAILQRHDRIDPAASAQHRPWQRFEHAAPNQLWQMDFKGSFPLAEGRCHPLTVLDDHARFSLCLAACPDERGPTVQRHLTTCFRRYGLPERLLMDNGAPWGDDWAHPYTPLTAWLIRLGIHVAHSRPYHPQTLGKDERFHRTVELELVRGRSYTDLAQCQQAFDAWRPVYNLERPHEALGLATPASCYRVSAHPFPERLPPIEYAPGDLVRKVQQGGKILLHGTEHRVGRAFYGYPVALRRTTTDGVWEVYFCHQRITTLDLQKAVTDA